MEIISSQHHLNAEIVACKARALELSNATSVIIPCSCVGEVDGAEYAIVVDGHHTMAAAKRLGLKIEFEISEDGEGLIGTELLDARYIDGDYYYVSSSDAESCNFDLVW